MKQRLINKHVTTTCEVMCDSWTRPMHASVPANILRTTCLKQGTNMQAGLPQVLIKIMVPPKDMHIMKITSLQKSKASKFHKRKGTRTCPRTQDTGKQRGVDSSILECIIRSAENWLLRFHNHCERMMRTIILKTRANCS